MRSGKIKFILKIVLIIVILVVIVVMISVGAMNAKRLSKQYNELSNKPVNSARQFRIPFGYITVSSDGTVDIQFADASNFKEVNPDVDDVEYEGVDPDDDTQSPGQDYQPDTDTGRPDGGTILDVIPSPHFPIPGTGDIRAIIRDDIAKGLYTESQIRAMVNVMAHEAYASNYPGCLGVGFVIKNRVGVQGFKGTIEEVCHDGMGSKDAYDSTDCPENYLRAAQYVLSGGASIVGDAKFWFCPTDGYPMWAEANCSGFCNLGGNIFYNTWGEVHTSVALPSDRDYIMIYDKNDGGWKYSDGQRYP